MIQDQHFRLFAQAALERIEIQPPGRVAGDAREIHTELHQRPHDRIVLHGADKHAAAGAQAALDGQVQRRRRARREQDAHRLGMVEKGAELLTQAERFQLRLLCGGIDAAVHARADAVEIVAHALAHARRFGKGRGGVVQINHRFSPRFCSIVARIPRFHNIFCRIRQLRICVRST